MKHENETKNRKHINKIKLLICLLNFVNVSTFLYCHFLTSSNDLFVIWSFHLDKSYHYKSNIQQYNSSNWHSGIWISSLDLILIKIRINPTPNLKIRNLKFKSPSKMMRKNKKQTSLEKNSKYKPKNNKKIIKIQHFQNNNMMWSILNKIT